jgi:hypothetical protein
MFSWCFRESRDVNISGNSRNCDACAPVPGRYDDAMNEERDPRVYFAAERTMLAWISCSSCAEASYSLKMNPSPRHKMNQAGANLESDATKSCSMPQNFDRRRQNLAPPHEIQFVRNNPSSRRQKFVATSEIQRQ